MWHKHQEYIAESILSLLFSVSAVVCTWRDPSCRYDATFSLARTRALDQSIWWRVEFTCLAKALKAMRQFVTSYLCRLTLFLKSPVSPMPCTNCHNRGNLWHKQDQENFRSATCLSCWLKHFLAKAWKHFLASMLVCCFYISCISDFWTTALLTNW